MSLPLIFWALLVPAIILIGALLWLTEDRKARARRWRQAGMTQAAIADRLNVSRTTVRRWIHG